MATSASLPLPLLSAYFRLAYRFGTPAWVIGRPQPSLVELVEDDELRGPAVVDVGCGTGDVALYLAERGFRVTGLDLSPTAVRRATAAARARDLDAVFLVHDALKLCSLQQRFDTVIDLCLLHQFEGRRLQRYMAGLYSLCAPGGRLVLECFCDAEGPMERLGPRLLTEDEVRGVLADGWRLDRLCRTGYETAAGRRPVWLAVDTRT